MALAHRRPAHGLIWHSDQGSQFVSLAFGQKARAAGIAQSMGSSGDCFDNAVAESFFATLKKELINRRTWPTKAELRTEVFDYIEVFYNRERRHSTLGQRSPADYENSTLSGPEQARRFAARIPQQDHVHCNNSEPTRLINPCPPNRGRSKGLFGFRLPMELRALWGWHNGVVSSVITTAAGRDGECRCSPVARSSCQPGSRPRNTATTGNDWPSSLRA